MLDDQRLDLAAIRLRDATQIFGLETVGIVIDHGHGRRNLRPVGHDTYIPLAHGFAYRVAIVDCYSRQVLAWRISKTLDAGFCVDCLLPKHWLTLACPRFLTPIGCQFTSEAVTGVLKSHDMAISRDGRGRALDNVFIERLWRSVKYEDVYLQGYETIPELILGLTRYFAFYNEERAHQSLDYLTPNEVYMNAIPTRAVETTATA